MVVLLPLATQSSSDVTDFSEVDSTPLGVFVIHISTVCCGIWDYR